MLGDAPFSKIFDSNYPLNTPILFLVFNRPDLTKKVFFSIKMARPTKLYIAADGPRSEIKEDVERCALVRSIVTDIDWPCDVKTRFRDQNYGCKLAVSDGISWFFDQEEMGIILEDDCLPTQEFFGFCQELLVRYKDDIRIGQISGFNPLGTYNWNDDTYLFSKFGPIWGWASWKRAWNTYDVNMSNWEEFENKGYLDFITDSFFEKNWRRDIFKKVVNNKINTWDYQWSFCKLLNGQINIIPTKNLVINIGFGENSTHTKGNIEKKYLEVFHLGKINHPTFILRNKLFDEKYLSEFVGLNLYKLTRKRVSSFKKLIYVKIFKKKWNTIIDKKINPIKFDEIDIINKHIVDVSSDVIIEWLNTGYLCEYVTDFIHKKGLEFYFSAKLLDIKDNHSILDAAGGRSNYLEAVRNNHLTNKLFLTDQIFSGSKTIKNGITIVGGDISSIDLERESIDRIACHHAFEHFQEDKDILFIEECYRILKDKGILVIIPFFISDKYYECWNIDFFKKFDKNSITLIDKSASLPGADEDGHFARIYDVSNLQRRILSKAFELGFYLEFYEFFVSGKAVPDMNKNFGSMINKPLRALKFTKV